MNLLSFFIGLRKASSAPLAGSVAVRRGCLVLTLLIATGFAPPRALSLSSVSLGPATATAGDAAGIRTARDTAASGPGARSQDVQEQRATESVQETGPAVAGDGVAAGEAGVTLTPDVEAFMESLGEALQSGSSRRIFAKFSLPGMLTGIAERGLLPELDEADRAEWEERLTYVLRQSSGRFSDLAWVKVKWIRADRINDDQWVILGRHYDDQETCHPMRWWLIRQGDEWRLADLQFIDMNLRLSALMVVGFEQAPAVWPEIRTFARLLQVVDRFKEGNLDDSEIEQMIVLTERLEHTKLPVELKSTILLCRVLGLAYQEELDPALEALDQMEKLSPNTPIVHELRGQIYASQERFGLAIPQFLKYGQMVGFDASLYESMADAAMADGKEEQSATYARLGLADQPESLGCLASLAAVLPVPQLSELDPYFKRHQHSEEMLSMVIDWCLSSEKMPAARYAYRALKKHQPQSELIEDLRSRLDYADY